ncbi:MAG: diadenylate cyclase CdaA [Pseudanabaenaceae cyanobacterium SKYGB_i_bin29]|nr:diadenylate cyclase CdaA [Pseudanabaenaceae cyanobacterium SKYG29]MDW8420869.1 diadenylate cyclase CdaA [Pseudanabaenaceae cyanobacterium SKYGB_i_bin29]
MQKLPTWLPLVIDITAVFLLSWGLLSLSNDRRTVLLARGYIFLVVVTLLLRQIINWGNVERLPMLTLVLNSLLTGISVALAVMFQTEIRRFLENLGEGNWRYFLPQDRQARAGSRSVAVIDEIIEAVRELSQNRTGALLVVETGEPIGEKDIHEPGVKIDAQLSKELLQTIFQTSTLLHDGAVIIRGDKIVAAGVILPLSERKASREIGTRHRAAMGITERIPECFCIVVSEETGSIGFAEGGKLERPISSSNLREILEAKLEVNTNITMTRRVRRFQFLWHKIKQHYRE